MLVDTAGNATRTEGLMDGGALASPIGAAATAVAPTTPKGKVTVKVRLSKASRRTLERKGRLRVRVTVRFTPQSGQARRATKSVTIKQPAGSKGKER